MLCAWKVAFLKSGQIRLLNQYSVGFPAVYVNLEVLPAICLVIILLSGDHISYNVRTILHGGLAGSMLYIVFAVCRPCFVRVMPTVSLVMLLFGDHASCSSCLQYVL